MASLLILADLVPAWISSSALAAKLSDFRVIYVAALVGRRYGWDQLYDVQATGAVTTSVIGNLTFDPLQIFDYPPPMAWLVAPLSWLPLAAAYWVWVGTGYAGLAGASRLALGPRTMDWTTGLIAAAAFLPAFRASFLGQPLPVMVLAVVIAWRLLLNDRQGLAGAALSVLCVKPHLALLLIAALAASGRFRAVLSWTIVTSALATASILLLGGRGLTAAIQAVQVEDSAALTHTLRVAPVGGRYSWLLVLVVAATTLILAFLARRQSAWIMVLGISGSLVVSPFLHLQDLMMLVPAAWIGLRSFPYFVLRWTLAPLAAAFDIAVVEAWGSAIETWSEVVAVALLATFVVFAAAAGASIVRPQLRGSFLDRRRERSSRTASGACLGNSTES